MPIGGSLFLSEIYDLELRFIDLTFESSVAHHQGWVIEGQEQVLGRLQIWCAEHFIVDLDAPGAVIFLVGLADLDTNIGIDKKVTSVIDVESNDHFASSLSEIALTVHVSLGIARSEGKENIPVHALCSLFDTTAVPVKSSCHRQKFASAHSMSVQPLSDPPA
jgi:hypothetical protein